MQLLVAHSSASSQVACVGLGGVEASGHGRGEWLGDVGHQLIGRGGVASSVGAGEKRGWAGDVRSCDRLGAALL
eukprot:8623338-Alexandrium_andersonii.AAC.1